MAIKDLHENPFNESTITKLGIFEDYAQAWIPTFVMQGRSPIRIFDFFAGTGYDKAGVAGSPIRILRKLREQIGPIFSMKVKITVHLNEYEPNKRNQSKFQLLQTACEEFLDDNRDLKRAIEVVFHNKDFEVLFPELKSDIASVPSLVFLDQNGIKFLSPQYLLELEKMRETDFLYFASASYLWRFGDVPEFTKHLQIDLQELQKEGYPFVHRNFIKQLRGTLPLNTKLKLYPFSLKKGSNIYGIIFGATHPAAFEKFLNIAWRANNINGEADFDIDDDISKRQGELFEPQLSKLELFQRDVRERVLSGEFHDNIQLCNFSLEEGHPGKHAADVVRKMKKAGEITFEGRSPMVNYEQAIKNKRKVDFTVLTK